jgi:hypothetical protein
LRRRRRRRRPALSLSHTTPHTTNTSYIQRRAREGFRQLADGSGTAASAPPAPAAADAAWSRAVADLEAFRRQSVVYGMYGRRVRTVLERDENAAAAAAASKRGGVK